MGALVSTSPQSQVQQQLVSHMRRLGLPLTSCGGDMEVLRKAIVQVCRGGLILMWG